MQLEDYFDFIAPDEIRIRGTRIGIEVVIYEYLDGNQPEYVYVNYPSLTLEQIHATITYYLRNRAEIDAYLKLLEARGKAALEAQRKSNDPLIQRLRAFRESLAKS